MLSKRIIPCLDVRAGKVTKGVEFQGNVDVGDPVAMARVYYEQGADELVFYDITASNERRGIMIEVVRAVAREIFIPFTVGGGDAYLQVPGECARSTCMFNTTTDPNVIFWPQLFNQFRLLLGYGHSGKQGFSAATNVGFDAKLGFLQYAAVQTTYNWDCCGVSLEFRRFALGSVRNENQYRFTFALANLGSLGNLRRTERLF